MRKCILITLFFILSLSLAAQEKNIEYLEQTWFAYFNQTRITNRSGIWVDLHLRFTGDFVDEAAVGIARIGYTYYLTDQARVTIGYAHATQYSGSPNVPEHRPWQQIQWFEKKSWLSMAHYIRLEERFRKEVVNGELTSDYNFNYRVRYNISISIPLTGKQVVAKTPFVFLNDELHVNFGEEIVNNYFDQNRLFIGIGYQFTSQLNAHLGYMKVFQQLPQPSTFRNIDAIRLFVFHNLDFSSKE